MNIIAYFLEYNRYLNVVGIFTIIGVAFCFSRNRRMINYRLIVMATLLQFVIGFCALKTNVGKIIIAGMSTGVGYLYTYGESGTKFLFGNLATNVLPWGSVFAVQILPIIIFFGAFMALLSYFGIVQRLVAVIGYVIRPILGTSGSETLCAVANSFLGQTEAPLLVRNYLATMTKSEMLVVMVSGMGTISGSILVIYSKFGAPVEHLLASSVMSIPATIMIAKILLPETEKIEDKQAQVIVDTPAGNVFDAISTGTSDGLSLALNVGAMLIAFYALVQMLNGCLGGVTEWVNYAAGTTFAAVSLDSIFSWICFPFAYLLGFTGVEATKVAQLLGTKVALNEFVAYLNLSAMDLSVRTTAITTYALCGFSNFSCIGIQVGGIGALVPSKRAWLTELGLMAVLGGALSNLLTAMVASLLI